MSLINDALIKAERDRTEAAIAEAARLDPLARERKRREQRKRQSLAPIVLNAMVLGALFAAVIVLVLRLRTPAASPSPDAAPPTLIARPEPAVLAPDPATPSPFEPPPAAEPPRPASTPDYALAGMSALGETTLLSIVRQSDRRSVWVPVGKSVGEVTAVSYDADQEEAVIRVGGRLFTLSMGATSGTEPAE